MENVYEQHGYSSREEYLECLAEEYGIPLYVVSEIADTLGMNEDFDGLINFCEDMDIVDWN